MTDYEIVVVHMVQMCESENPLELGSQHAQAGSILMACERYPNLASSIANMLDDDKLTTIEQTFMEVTHQISRMQENKNVT